MAISDHLGTEVVNIEERGGGVPYALKFLPILSVQPFTPGASYSICFLASSHE